MGSGGESVSWLSQKEGSQICDQQPRAGVTPLCTHSCAGGSASCEDETLLLGQLVCCREETQQGPGPALQQAQQEAHRDRVVEPGMGAWVQGQMWYRWLPLQSIYTHCCQAALSCSPGDGVDLALPAGSLVSLHVLASQSPRLSSAEHSGLLEGEYPNQSCGLVPCEWLCATQPHLCSLSGTTRHPFLSPVL